MFVAKQQTPIQIINNLVNTSLTDLPQPQIDTNNSPQMTQYRQAMQFSPNSIYQTQNTGNLHQTIFQTINNQQQQQRKQTLLATNNNQFAQCVTQAKLNTSDIILSNIGSKVSDLSEEIKRLLAVNEKLVRESQVWHQKFEQSLTEKKHIEQLYQIQNIEIQQLKEKLKDHEQSKQQQNQQQPCKNYGIWQAQNDAPHSKEEQICSTSKNMPNQQNLEASPQKRVQQLESELEEWKNKFNEQERIHNKEITLLKTNLRNSIVECDEEQEVEQDHVDEDGDSDQEVIELDENEIQQQFNDWRQRNDNQKKEGSKRRSQKQSKSSLSNKTQDDSEQNSSRKLNADHKQDDSDQHQLTLLAKLQKDKQNLQQTIKNLMLEIECFSIQENQSDPQQKAAFNKIFEKLQKDYQESERQMKQQLEELQQENEKQSNLNKILQQEIISAQLEKMNLQEKGEHLPEIMQQLFDSDEYFEEVESDDEESNQIRKQRNEILQNMSPTAILKGKVKYLENKNQHLEKELEEWKRELWNLEKKLYQEQQMKEQIQKDQLYEIKTEHQEGEKEKKTGKNKLTNNFNKAKILAKRKSQDNLIQLESNFNNRNLVRKLEDRQACTKSPSNCNVVKQNNIQEVLRQNVLRHPSNIIQQNACIPQQQQAKTNLKLVKGIQEPNQIKSQRVLNNNETRQYRTVTYYSNKQLLNLHPQNMYHQANGKY